MLIRTSIADNLDVFVYIYVIAFGLISNDTNLTHYITI